MTIASEVSKYLSQVLYPEWLQLGSQEEELGVQSGCSEHKNNLPFY